MQGAMMYPFAMAGTKVFISIEHKLTRVDWVTGKILTVTNQNTSSLFRPVTVKRSLALAIWREKINQCNLGLLTRKHWCSSRTRP